MKVIATYYVFASDSNPDKSYQTLQYIDGSVSCDCKGFTFKRGPVRTCKHVRLVDAGIADRHCVSKVDYGTRARQINRSPVGFAAGAVKRKVSFD